MRTILFLMYCMLVSCLYGQDINIDKNTSIYGSNIQDTNKNNSEVNRTKIFADRYSFIKDEDYKSILEKRKQLIVSEQNIETIAKLETYIYLYKWEELNKRPISTLPSAEVDKIMTKFFNDKVDELKKNETHK